MEAIQMYKRKSAQKRSKKVDGEKINRSWDTPSRPITPTPKHTVPSDSPVQPTQQPTKPDPNPQSSTKK